MIYDALVKPAAALKPAHLDLLSSTKIPKYSLWFNFSQLAIIKRYSQISIIFLQFFIKHHQPEIPEEAFFCIFCLLILFRIEQPCCLVFVALVFQAGWKELDSFSRFMQ